MLCSLPAVQADMDMGMLARPSQHSSSRQMKRRYTLTQVQVQYDSGIGAGRVGKYGHGHASSS